MENGKKFEPKKRQLSQSLLKEEIVQLEKELEGQTVVRSALEKAMNRQLLLDDPAYKSLSQSAEDLIKEIALLELEVVYLEKYLLSLYRRTFAKRLSTLPTADKRPKTDVETPNSMSLQLPKTNLEPVNEDSVIGCGSSVPLDDSANTLPVRSNDILGADALIDSGIYRSQSSLSHQSACSFRASPPFEAVAEAVDAYHSLPLSMLERTQDQLTSNANPEEYLGSSFCIRESPNWLSEEMIKCISSIYCHLSESPPSCEENSWLNNPFHYEPSKETSGTFFEVNVILTDCERLNSVQDLLQDYRSLICRLAQVDPGKLKHDEKLAFWINVHNALVMHAFLVYGIPRGSLKRVSLVLKAAYNIGGHTISVDKIQSSILRCRLPRPTQWLHSLFFPKTKFKAGDPRKSYALKHPEPRLHFALCSGCQSDPPVRLYTHKKVFQELEIAKEEYIQMNTKLHKEQKLLIPKNVEYFIKEMSLSPLGMVEMLDHSMPQSLDNNFQQLKQKLLKKVDWIPHIFTFQFQISNELVR
ncbi:hypothetical protein CDL12_15025 [Handroanthus impetiginosus]|uniref:Ternary complex factor MIP1, leucine-zipper n=1 Tax=Handroanthus impetiginosus TaxID=429701 RepID=A0A2G9H4C8_9LAMI|nr:hypothetical protein CDL12_15025 [Handroanthus impetiginosus]